MKRVVFNQKGGVGKSTIVCNLAAISAYRGASTLVVDLDGQANASQYLLGEDADEIEPTVAGMFEKMLKRFVPSVARQYVVTTPYENLDLMVASPELSDLQPKLEAKHKIYKLRSALEALEDEYDEIYIDTPPRLNFYSLSALIAADNCLIPFDCDDFSRRALYTLLDNLEEVREDHNDDLWLEGIIVNHFQSRANLPQRVVEELRSEKLPVLKPPISSSIIVKESHEAAAPLINFAPSHKVTQEYQDVFDAMRRRRRPR